MYIIIVCQPMYNSERTALLVHQPEISVILNAFNNALNNILKKRTKSDKL